MPFATPEKLQMQVQTKRYQLKISLGLSLMAFFVAAIMFGFAMIRGRSFCAVAMTVKGWRATNLTLLLTH
jgi:hypothetical protein